VWETVKARPEQLIPEWPPRTTSTQRISAMRLHRQLRAEHYRIRRRLVGNHRSERRQRTEVYVPLSHRPNEAQIDVFEVVVNVGG
jgi:hypothetical protein